MAIFSSIAAGISGLLAGTFLAGGVGAFILKAAVGIGLNLLASSLAGQPEQTPFAIQGQLQSGGDVARSFPIGYTATAGSFVYANTWADGGKTPNAYFTQVIALADLPGCSLAGLWVNGEKCTIDYDNHAYPDWGFPVKEYEDDGDNALWIKFYDGTQTVADPFLVNTVSSPNRPYQDTRVGVGVAYVVITAQIKEELFTGFPQFKFELNGIKLYDPSKDSSVGGVGPQRWSDPSTWGGDGDHLPAVQLYNVLRGVTFQGTWFYGLQGMSAARLPVSAWIAAIGKCRATIKGTGGALEPMFRCGGEIQVGAQIADAVKAILTSAQARLSEAGGEYTMHIGASDVSTYGITDADILSTEEQSFSPFFGLADTINGIVATYPSPAEGWNAKPAPPRYSPTFEAEDGNRRLLSDVTLDFVPYKAQVQRLMKSALEEARRARRHTFVLPPKYWPLMPGDFVTWTSVRNGYVSKKFRVDGVIDRENLDIVVDMTEVDPTDYDWEQDVDFRAEPDGELDRSKPLPQPIVDWYAAPAEVKDGLGVPRRPAILLSWDNDAGRLIDVSAIKFAVRLKATAEVVLRGRTDEPSAGAILISQNLLPKVTYQARGILVPVSDRKTTWSDWLDVTTPEILLAADDILDGAIVAAKLADAAVEANKIMTGAVTELKLADRAVSDLKIKLAAVKTELIDNQAVVAAALADVAVVTAKLADNAVQVAKVADNAILMAKLADNAVTVNKIASGAVIASKIADAAITTAKFAAGLTPVEIVTSLPTTGNFEGRQAFYNGKLYRYASGAWTASVSAADIAGTIVATEITDNSVTTPKLAANAVIASKIATDAITADKIAANAIIAGKIAAGAVTATEIAAGAITVQKLLVASLENPLAGAEIETNSPFVSTSPRGTWATISTSPTGKPTALRINGAVAGATTAFNFPPKLAVTAGEQYYIEFYVRRDSAWDGSGGNSKLRIGSQDNSLLAGYPYGAGDLAANTWVKRTAVFTAPSGVTELNITLVGDGTTGNVWLTDFVFRKMASAELIVDGAIIADKIAVNAVTTAKINAGAVTATEIATNAVTAVKVLANAITTEKINAGAVTATEVASSAIIAVKIAANAVTTDKINTNAVTANEIAAGTITATELGASSVTALKIAAEAVTAAKIAANSVGANHIAANSITAKQLVIMDWENIAPNGQWLTGDNAGWSSYPTGWNVVGGGARPPQRGDYILSTPGVADDRTMTTAGLDVPLQGGEQFNVQFDCAGSGSGASWGFRVRCVWYGAGAYISGSTVALDGTSVGWQRAIGTMSAPAAADRLNRIEITRVGGGSNNAFITNVIIRRKKGGELIVDGAITADHLAVNSITVGKIADGSITNDKLGSSAVTAVKIANGAITAAKIEAGTITADRLVLGGVTTDRIRANAVTLVSSAYSNGNTGDFGPSGATTVTIQSASISLADADAIDIVVSFGINQSAQYWTSSPGTTVTTVELLRGTTVINTITVNDSSFGLDPSSANARYAIRPTVSFSFSDTSFTGTGTVTYSVRCSSVYGAGTVTARNRYMRLMATKR
ncbi:phage tail protein [Mycoplana rhizolycopersici]|uniref:Tip attachment protein J domain-containing protein n=1 Tax=Mycoplana rhizolycopersici TaxID=2746702 RepID=A0ABX2Q9Z5_9HYPH|nr:phage tail protein [Rhizobium rhizolycopersici]NVP54450.1 hypothetical protein [Rhizobium rhizolycopersici]